MFATISIVATMYLTAIYFAYIIRAIAIMSVLDFAVSAYNVASTCDHISALSIIMSMFVFDALLKINDSDFSNEASLDMRIKSATGLMHEHFSEILSNQDICEKINMSQTNFIRLFRQELGISPQKYLRTIKIEKATYMLCYTCRRIEEIATMTGFTDRYHFSRVFKQQMRKSPAAYRKQMIQI